MSGKLIKKQVKAVKRVKKSIKKCQMRSPLLAPVFDKKIRRLPDFFIVAVYHI